MDITYEKESYRYKGIALTKAEDAIIFQINEITDVINNLIDALYPLKIKQAK